MSRILLVTRFPPKIEICVLTRDTQEICAEFGLEKLQTPTNFELETRLAPKEVIFTDARHTAEHGFDKTYAKFE